MKNFGTIGARSVEEKLAPGCNEFLIRLSVDQYLQSQIRSIYSEALSETLDDPIHKYFSQDARSDVEKIRAMTSVYCEKSGSDFSFNLQEIKSLFLTHSAGRRTAKQVCDQYQQFLSNHLYFDSNRDVCFFTPWTKNSRELPEKVRDSISSKYSELTEIYLDLHHTYTDGKSSLRIEELKEGRYEAALGKFILKCTEYLDSRNELGMAGFDVGIFKKSHDMVLGFFCEFTKSVGVANTLNLAAGHKSNRRVDILRSGEMNP